ncbi:MAG: hypothetical protein KTR31_02525 [Myxococcales bacterium]|nr:hypothetical protein [Myxococcales bacterium]
MLILTSMAVAATPTPRLGALGHMASHPGLTAGVEWELATSERWSSALAADIGAYWHVRNQVATWVRGEWAGRHHGRRRGIQELFVTTGPLRATWAAPTYAVVDDEVRRRPLAGDTYWTVGGGVGLGQMPRSGPVSAWLVRPTLQVRFPHHLGLGVDVSVEVTTRFGRPA